MIPKNCEWVDGWAEFKGSNVVPKIDHISRKHLDVHYGPDKLQALDIYLPEEGNGPWPVFVLIHGGGFSACDKRDFHLYPGFFARERGYAVVSINYRLAPKHKFPVGLEDVKQSIIWICDHGEEYGFDPQRLFLFGPSAGGNLSALAGMQGWQYLEGKGKIRAMAPLCPAVDLLNVATDYKTIPNKDLSTDLAVWLMMRWYFGKDRKDPKVLEAASFMPYVSGKTPPTYIQIGDQDPVIPMQGVRQMYQDICEAIGQEHVCLDLMPGAVHSGGDENYYLRENIERILDFFDRYID